MADPASDASDRARLFEKAISRWENEGGALGDGPPDPASTEASADVASVRSAEFVQLQIRVIALENLVTVLLAESSDRQLALMREMAGYIAPRPGSTPHRLTVHAAARMLSLVQAAGHLRGLCSVGEMGVNPLEPGPPG